MYRLQLEAG